MEIETARKLESAVLNKIKKVFGEKSEITELVNKELLGGARITVNDMIYDASLKTQLKSLRQQLIS